MKVYIPYQQAPKHDAFEGARLRKTLKGQCELSGLEWTDQPVSPDIAHFLSPREETEEMEMLWRHIHVVVSALYAENDMYVRFFDGNKQSPLSPRSLRVLNNADLVLVPAEYAKADLRKAGVVTQIEVAEPSVNLDRFAETNLEREIFPRYFGIRPNDFIAVSTGEFSDGETIARIKELAACCPEIQFYFFGSTRRQSPRLPVRFHSPLIPKNLHFKSIVQDDVYRSALMRSSVYVSLHPHRANVVGVLEAFAAKKQVVALESETQNPWLVHEKTGFLFPDVKSMGEYLSSLYSKNAPSTIMAAFAIAKSHSLQAGANRLKELYLSLLEKRTLKGKEDIHA